jgi:hypothetical protein
MVEHFYCGWLVSVTQFPFQQAKDHSPDQTLVKPNAGLKVINHMRCWMSRVSTIGLHWDVVDLEVLIVAAPKLECGGRILESMCVTDIGQTKLKRRCLSSVRFEWIVAPT